jgi:hypothetical protein
MSAYCGSSGGSYNGAAWDVDHTLISSTTGWFISSNSGTLFGNGKDGENTAGAINSGQIPTIEADLGKSTLRFWVAGKPHGPGYTSGVTGRLRFAAAVSYKGSSVQIVPTPALLT